MVVLPGLGQTQAAQVAEKIRTAIAAIRIEGLDDEPLPHVTVSVGVVELGDSNASGHDLVLLAEQAKGRAKAQGRNKVAF